MALTNAHDLHDEDARRIVETIRRARARLQGDAGEYSLGQLFWLGQPDERTVAAAGAWGGAATTLSGCFRTRFATWTFRQSTGYSGTGILAADLVELKQQIAERLVELGLPAALMRGVLSAATYDYVLEVPAQTATLTVVPDDGTFVSGGVTMRASVDPVTTRIEQIAFYADGQLVCTVTTRPFECGWDAGPGVTEHAIRIVATLPGGARIAKNVRTKDPGFTESVDVGVSERADLTQFIQNEKQYGAAGGTESRLAQQWRRFLEKQALSPSAFPASPGL